jgi:hypothetical protein
MPAFSLQVRLNTQAQIRFKAATNQSHSHSVSVAHSAKFSGTRVALSAAYPVDDLVLQFTHVGPTGLDKCRRHFGATLHPHEECALFGSLQLPLFERGFHPKAFHIDMINTSFRNFFRI